MILIFFDSNSLFEIFVGEVKKIINGEIITSNNVDMEPKIINNYTCLIAGFCDKILDLSALTSMQYSIPLPFTLYLNNLSCTSTMCLQVQVLIYMHLHIYNYLYVYQ